MNFWANSPFLMPLLLRCAVHCRLEVLGPGCLCQLLVSFRNITWAFMFWADDWGLRICIVDADMHRVCACVLAEWFRWKPGLRTCPAAASSGTFIYRLLSERRIRKWMSQVQAPRVMHLRFNNVGAVSADATHFLCVICWKYEMAPCLPTKNPSAPSIALSNFWTDIAFIIASPCPNAFRVKCTLVW